MNKTEHLTVDDLILFMDREVDGGSSAKVEQHLLNCTDCAKRLRSLKSGSDAYVRVGEVVPSTPKVSGNSVKNPNAPPAAGGSASVNGPVPPPKIGD